MVQPRPGTRRSGSRRHEAAAARFVDWRSDQAQIHLYRDALRGSVQILRPNGGAHTCFCDGGYHHRGRLYVHRTRTQNIHGCAPRKFADRTAFNQPSEQCADLAGLQPNRTASAGACRPTSAVTQAFADASTFMTMTASGRGFGVPVEGMPSRCGRRQGRSISSNHLRHIGLCSGQSAPVSSGPEAGRTISQNIIEASSIKD